MLSRILQQNSPQVNAPAAYFTALTVVNHRCFGYALPPLNLSDAKGHPARWTVILGENGTGKTTLLQCLAFMQPEATIFEKPIRNDGDFVPRLFHFDSFFDAIVLGSPAAEPSLPVTSESGNVVVRVNVAIGNPLNNTSGTYDQRTFSVNATKNFRRADPLSKDFSGLICYGYGASRRMSRKALLDSRSEDTCSTLFDDTADLMNAEEWLVLTDYATKTGTDAQKTRAKTRYNRIKTLLISILPDVTDFHFGTTDNTAMTPRVEAKTPYGWVRVADLSLGYKTALTWIVDFASRLFERYPDSENPLAEPAICLVDEIDLHLHPRWQRELLKMLNDTFSNTQFIVTAHSPLIVQAAPNANLALLRREGDHVVIDNDVDHIRKWRVDQILASELFGEQPTHAREVEDLFEQRTRLAQKSNLTPTEKVRLTELDAEIDRLPTAAAPEDREAIDIIRRAAALLQKEL